MRVTLASRRSDLARIQAFQVGAALRMANPHVRVNYSFHESLGDKNLTDPLWQMPEKGVFTQDFREGLLRGEFDLVVHSWKDLAIEEDPETEIAATLPRADARDLLLVRSDRWPRIVETGTINVFTSSPRRAYNLDSFLRAALPADINELNFTNVRGNVPTRVRKLIESVEVDALIVAKAAIDRLLEAPQSEFGVTRAELRTSLSRCRWMVLPLSANPSAPAQGALAVEILRGRDDIRQLLQAIQCKETYEAVRRERAVLASYGGGCHQKIGASVLRRPYGEITYIRGVTDAGQVLNSRTLNPSRPRPPKVTKDAMWPIASADADWFTRERVVSGPGAVPDGSSGWSRGGVSIPSAPEPPALWIAKAEALPESWPHAVDQIIWASGTQTWKRLARAGHWVNGCADGIGEHEPPGIETLLGAKLDWLKLTHESGYTGAEMASVGTYRLIPKDEPIDLDGKRYFFWKSGSSFDYALSSSPWLKEMTHFCGPGNTQRILERHGIEPHICLDHAQWLEEMCQDEAGSDALDDRNQREIS